MDRGVWWATDRGCKRVGHDLVTKQQLEKEIHSKLVFCM